MILLDPDWQYFILLFFNFILCFNFIVLYWFWGINVTWACSKARKIGLASEQIAVVSSLSRVLLCNIIDCSPPVSSLYPWDFPGKNPGMSCRFLLQGILPTQGLNPHLLRWQADCLPLSQPWVNGWVQLTTQHPHLKAPLSSSFWDIFTITGIVIL